MDTPDISGQEIVVKGIAAAPGIAFGPAYLYSKQIPHVQAKSIGPDHAFARLGGGNYDKAAADLANSRTADFFKKNLG